LSKILIIGASGYIGARLSYSLSKNGHEVTALCFPTIPDHSEWVATMQEVIVGDITSETTINEITDKSFDTAIHLVSLDHHDSNKKPELVNSINVMPVWNLLESFKQKKTLEKFIYFSTIQVYGKLPSGVIHESLKPNPLTPYGLTHLMAEEICNMFNVNSNMSCINLRLSNSYGSPMFGDANCWWLVINDLCRQAVKNKEISLLSDGSPMRDFIHSTDVIKAVEAIINNHTKFLHGNNLNLSSGKTTTILELAHLIQNLFKKQFGLEIPVVLPDQKLSDTINTPLLKTKYVVDNSKFKHLGFNPQTSLEEGITELFNYLSGLNE